MEYVVGMRISAERAHAGRVHARGGAGGRPGDDSARRRLRPPLGRFLRGAQVLYLRTGTGPCSTKRPTSRKPCPFPVMVPIHARPEERGEGYRRRQVRHGVIRKADARRTTRITRTRCSTGKPQDIKRCKRCNECLMRAEIGMPVRCIVNKNLGREKVSVPEYWRPPVKAMSVHKMRVPARLPDHLRQH